jgi:Tfp pilus assembly protein PilF
MNAELWRRLRPLFHNALDCAVEDRAAFIDAACGDDAELKENLVKLVQAAQEGAETLDTPFIRFAQPSFTHFSSGEIILGRFRIVRPIGSGGMGDVYEAEDLQLGRVALKTIRQDIASSPEAFDRFRQEVQLARKISGAQVCRIHELYLIPADRGRAATAFLTMEYLDGTTLSQRLKDSGPLPVKQAQVVALDICEGLRLVHAKGVIHRDLKSANIMLCGEGGSMRAVLMDFGLARDSGVAGPDDQTSPIASAQDRTLPGAIMGTPAYMAPEQFEGKAVSPATDIYALGIVLYELITGLRPYAAPTPVAAAIRRAQRPTPPSSLIHSVPRKWDRIIQRCLQYAPAERFQSADEVAKALRAGPADLGNLRKDRPWLFVAACTLAAACLAWGIVNWWQTRQYYRPGPEALRQYDNGLSLIRQGNYAEATRVLQAALGHDKHFVMAHARLAEAWYNLDFQGSAQQELLIALPERDRLPSLDRKYLDAIHATVTGEPFAALEDYKRILDDLPSSAKSSGYVDLGMAYERAGDIPHSLDSYAQAAALDGNNPAAYMHTGILQSRLHHVQQGDQAFARAQAIFGSEVDSFGRAGNPEGLAELDYERGYAANDNGNRAAAIAQLTRSLDGARTISSVQLEIRALTQLSSVENSMAQISPSVEHAEQAVRLAEDNQLGSWAANGLVRLASAQLSQRNLTEAEKPLQEAFQILHQNPQPRTEALANITLASLRNQQHRPSDVTGPAQAALEYYQGHGFFSPAFNAAMLLVRTERDQGQYKQALTSGNQLLAVAAHSGIPVLKMQAEETVGTVDLMMELYPDALTHFQNAEDSAGTDSLRSYQALHCAETLWRLGRYIESDAMFSLASGDPSLAAYVGEGRVESLLSQRKYQAALDLAQQTIAANKVISDVNKRYLEQDEAIAESHLGMKQQALKELSVSVAPDQSKDNPSDTAQNKLTDAEIYLWSGMNEQARDAAMAALDFFTSAGKLESALESAYLAAAASKALKNEPEFDSLSKKLIDIQHDLEHNWGPEPFQTYLSRPDLHALMQRTSSKRM